jgi:hypothetical protein
VNNTIAVPWALAGLVVAFGAAVGLGLVAQRIEVRRNLIGGRDGRLVSDGMGGAGGFLGGAAAFLLGVLMLASIDHYYATRSGVDAEAVAYAAAFNAAATLPASDQDRIQRDLVCLMRSVSTDSWEATAAEQLTGARNTDLWRARIRGDVGGRTEDPPRSPTVWMNSSPSCSRPPSQVSNGCSTAIAIFPSCCGFWCTSAFSCWSS